MVGGGGVVGGLQQWNGANPGMVARGVGHFGGFPLTRSSIRYCVRLYFKIVQSYKVFNACSSYQIALNTQCVRVVGL